MKNSLNPKTETKKAVKTLSAELLKSVTAFAIKSNIQTKVQSGNEIFKKGFHDSKIRSKSRKKLFALSEKIIASVKNNDISALMVHIENLENHCITYYKSENKFDKIENYYTSQRDDEKTIFNKELLSKTFEIVNSLKED